MRNRPCLKILLGLLLAVLLVAPACSDDGPSSSATGENRSMRGIQPVSKSAARARQRRLALVMGNEAYSKSPLKNPVNDARAMARLLGRLDFEVTLKENGNRREMITMLNDFSRKLRDVDVGLFYYAGHGIQAKGRNYLIPIDSRLETEADVEFEALDLGRVLGKMEDAGCPLNIVVLDACRDNPFARSFRSAAKGLAMVDAPRGTLLAFATAPGSVAADGDSGNGVYTRHLLANMERPNMSIEEVFKQVRIGVVGDTGGRQTPWETSSLMGSFYFQPGLERPALSPSPAASTPQPQPVAKASPPPAPVPVSPPAAPAPVQVAHVEPAPAPAVSKPKVDTEVSRYLKMLNSGNPRDQRYAAKKICRSYTSNQILLKAAEQELLKGYAIKSRDSHHIDAMAWLCNVLGRSKESRYAATLRRVAQQSPNAKLKKYADKNLRMLR